MRKCLSNTPDKHGNMQRYCQGLEPFYSLISTYVITSFLVVIRSFVVGQLLIILLAAHNTSPELYFVFLNHEHWQCNQLQEHSYDQQIQKPIWLTHLMAVTSSLGLLLQTRKWKVNGDTFLKRMDGLWPEMGWASEIQWESIGGDCGSWRNIGSEEILVHAKG